MYGIDKIKQALGFAIKLGDNVHKALEDKKYSFPEIIGTALVVKDVIPIVKKAPELFKELGDLDTAEKHEIEDWVESEFDIPNDKVERRIEKAINLLLAIYDFAMTFKEIELPTEDIDHEEITD